MEMNIRHYLILGWIVAGLQIFSAAQNSTTQSSGDKGINTAPAGALSSNAGLQPASAAEEDTNSSLPQIPALLGGVGISTEFLSEMARSNYLRGGVNVGATYDDNPLLASTGQLSNTSETIFPNIKVEESTSRTRWALGYAGGLTINQKITNQNQGSHNVLFDSQFRLSPHVNLRMAETFAYTTGYFDSGNGTGGVAGSGGPNPSLITPLASQLSSLTTVEMNYHFALNDLIGGSGSFYDLHFSNVPTPVAGSQTTTLSNAQTASGSAFWLHRLFRKDWGGISYRFDRITFDPNGESQVHSFLGVNTWEFSKHITLTGFAGPQYSKNLVGGVPATPNSWSVSGGAEGGWQDQRTSLTFGYSRSISDGGGVLGAVHLQNAYGTFRRELFPGWTAAFNASHGTNQAITLISASNGSSINLTSAGITLERNVGKSFGFRLGYSHDFQERFGVPGLTSGDPLQMLDAHRNRFFATLSYQWSKPLGM
jgi:hypothetical protein